MHLKENPFELSQSFPNIFFNKLNEILTHLKIPFSDLFSLSRVVYNAKQ